MITLAALNDLDGIRHGFLTREGGVSDGIYASLNCGLGSNDAAEAVRRNRELAMARLDRPTDSLVTCHQAHTGTCVVVDTPWAPGAGPQADAMVTRSSDVTLGILTADCVPVLFADEGAGVIGAAHAGWKGAKGGILEATLATMIAQGARRSAIVAAIGPCIAQRSYEVGPEFPLPFLEETPANGDFFAAAARAGHFLFDVAGYVGRRLTSAGIELIQRAPNDTVAEADRFFSYRRACLKGEGDYGRHLSAIALMG